MSGINSVFIPVINYLGNEHKPTAEVLGAYMYEIEALHAIISRLVELEYILKPKPVEGIIYPESIEYMREVLYEGDNEGNIQKLCKLVSTMDDVKKICNDLGEDYYNTTLDH